jgi:hypothetical protein
VVLPWGPPEGFVFNLSGTFTKARPMSAEITTVPTSVTDPRPARHPFQRNRHHTKQTNKETVRIEF